MNKGVAVNRLVDEFLRGRLVNVAPAGEPMALQREMALLEQLEQAKTARLHTGAGVSGSPGGSRLPFGAEAADIEAEILRVVHEGMPAHTRYRRDSLGWKLRAWADANDPDYCLDWLEYWKALILDLFVDKQVLQGQCPVCKSGERLPDPADSARYRPALVVSAYHTPVRVDFVAYCNNPQCASRWEGLEELHKLSQQI